MLTRFLWKGASLQKYGAKVSWRKITFPFEEGGLGIKDLKEWNQSLLLAQLLKIINPFENSLWANWIRAYQLQGKALWLSPIPSCCSWTWRKLLRLRHLALPFLKYEIGNGEHTALWTDPWLSSKPLVTSLNSPLIYNSGLSCFAKVSSIIVNSSWHLPSSNHHAVIEFRQSFNSALPCNSSRPDQIFWDGHRINDVNATTIWNSIRLKENKMNWSQIAWCKGLPPRYSFLLWIIFHNGLKTKDKLASYGININPICDLCNKADESFSHLFFNCPVAFRVTVPILRRCGWRGFSRNWASIVSLITSGNLPFQRTLALCHGLALSVYSIWHERNSRLHGNRPNSLHFIIHHVMHLLTCRALTFKNLNFVMS